MTNEQFLKKAQIVHPDKYDYPNLDLTKEKIDIVCRRCGLKFPQTIAVHLYDQCGCRECAKKTKKTSRKTTEQFVKEAKEMWGDIYDYSKTIYITAHDDVIITCLKHGDFHIRAYAHVAKNEKKQGCKKCGYKLREMPNQKTTEQFIKEAKEIWGDIYDYSNTKYINKHTKIEYACKKHGIIEQYPYRHLKHGCNYCNGRGINKHNHISFVNIANKIHNSKYTYPNIDTIFKNMSQDIDICCPIHGVFPQRAGNHIHLVNGCPKCVSNVSKAEKDLLKYIRENYEGEIIENDRKVLGGLEIDIYLPELKLGFEYHGIYWHLETVRGKNYHYNKWEKTHEQGIKLLQIYDTEWDNKKEILKSKILYLFGKLDRIGARKTEIVELGKHTQQEFLIKNHLQGYAPARIAYGLEYNGELVSCMTFGPDRNKRKGKQYDYEMIRFCNKNYISVAGGAKRLLDHFVENHKGSIVTYADRRYSNGELYEKLKFKKLPEREINISFDYFNISTNQLYNRRKFQKHKLINMPYYDEKLTEYAIMQLNGYDRIWGAGQYVFVKEN